MPQPFTNVHVFGAGTNRSERLARLVADAVRARLKADGFDPVPREEAADREVAVVIPPRGNWVTVLDEASEGDRAAIDGLARQLSHDLGTPTLSVAGDGKVAAVSLHTDGDTVGCLPDDAGAGELPEPWRMVLAPGMPLQELARAWEKPDGALARTARLLALDPSVTDAGFSALGRLGLSGARLRFKDTAGTGAAKGPRLRAGMMPGQTLTPTPGQPFKIRVITQNRGATGMGVQVTLRGRILSDESLEVRSVALLGLGFQEEQRPKFRVVRNDRVIQASFEAAPLPGGGATGVLTLTLDCQLARALQVAEPLDVAFEPKGAAGGGCAVQLLVGPTAG